MDNIRKEIDEMKNCLGEIIMGMATTSLKRDKLVALVKRIHRVSSRLLKYLEG